MKIFLSFLQSGDSHPIPGYSFWEYYLKNGICENADEWIECKEIDWAYGLVNQSKESFNEWKANSWQKTIDYLKKNPADIFLSYLYPDMVDESAINVIQSMGIPCVNFFCDNVRNFKKIPTQFKSFDLNWVPEYKALQLYKLDNLPTLHLPMPMWVAPTDRVSSGEVFSQISFIGSADMQRVILFDNIVSAKEELPLSIFGNGWIDNDIKKSKIEAEYTLQNKIRFQYDFIKQEGLAAYIRKIMQRKNTHLQSKNLNKYLKGKLDYTDYVRISKGSVITIGVNRYPSFRYPLSKPNTYSRLRDIEAPMLGCCYLTEWTDGLDHLYDINTEIMVYYSAEHFISQTQRLIDDKKLRDTLRVKGQIRALADHSIANSLKKIKAHFQI